MKNFHYILFLVLISKSQLTFSQKIIEGKIIYQISYPEIASDDGAKDMMPSESVFYFKDNQIRMEIKMMGMTTVVISNAKDKSATTLMDMMGNKYAIKLTAEDIEKEKSKMSGVSKFDVKLTNETKIIAGYTCKKAVASTKEGNTITIFYTNDILAKNQGFSEQYKGIDGFPMEYEMAQNGMNMKFMAKSVTKEKVDASRFIIPSDYKITTKEELAKMFGGGR